MESCSGPRKSSSVFEAYGEIRRIYFGDRGIARTSACRTATAIPPAIGRATSWWSRPINLKEQEDQAPGHSDQARIVERYSLGATPRADARSPTT